MGEERGLDVRFAMEKDGCWECDEADAGGPCIRGSLSVCHVAEGPQCTVLCYREYYLLGR